MILTAFIYDSVFWQTQVNTIDLLSQTNSVIINKDLVSFSSAFFSLQINDPVTIWQKIEIVQETVDSSSLVFEWYIYKETPVVDWVNTRIDIECRDLKHYLTTRKALQWYSFSDQPLQNILQILIDDYNSKWDNWRVSSQNVNTSLQIWTWSSYYEAINSAVSQLWYEWEVVWQEIKVAQSIWSNKTVSGDFEEIVYIPYWGNVTDIQITQENTVANVVVTSDWTNTIIYPSPLPPFITGVAYNYVRWWDLVQASIAELERIAEWVTQYSVNVVPWSIDAGIGDIVSLRIEWLWKYDFVWNTKILSKRTEYIDWNTVDTYSVWQVIKKPRTIASVIDWLQQQVNILQTQ